MKQLSKEAMASVSGGKLETTAAMVIGAGAGDGGGGLAGSGGGSIDVSRAEIGTLAAAIGGGVGASLAIETAGGWGAIGAMGSGAAGLMAAGVAGVAAAGSAGYLAGDYLYHHSEFVQEWSQAAVGAVVETINEAFPEYPYFDLNSEYGGTIGDTDCTALGNKK